MVAIALIDERLSDPSPELLMSRSRRILHHYNRAIHQITDRDPSLVDTISCSLLAWVLQTFLSDTTRAIMHLDASSRLIEKAQADGLRDDGSESNGLILKDLKSAKESCAGYLSTKCQLAPPQYRDQTSIFTMLVARHGPQRMKSTREARAILKRYFATCESPQDAQLDVAEARDFLRSWELTLLKYKHTFNEPHVNVVALHLLLNIALTLLPREERSPSDAGMNSQQASKISISQWKK